MANPAQRCADRSRDPFPRLMPPNPAERVVQPGGQPSRLLSPFPLLGINVRITFAAAQHRAPRKGFASFGFGFLLHGTCWMAFQSGIRNCREKATKNCPWSRQKGWAQGEDLLEGC